MLQALAVAAVPFAIALVGHLYTSALKEREIQARMVELAVAILQAPPDTATYNLRSWAIRVVNQYSRVPLDSLVAADLRKAVPLPAPQTTDPEAPSGGSGLPPGTPVPLTLNLPWPAHVTYRRWTSKDLVRELGQFPKGVTDTTLPYGGYVYFLAASLTTRDTLTRNAHCEQGCSVEF
jgi:hypothetical protein